jgi:hypothetical protein
MADLSNLKISSTFPRVLQRDPDTGQLQNLVGNKPTNLIIQDTTLRYVDGNQQNNYILTSDADGNARWAVNSGGGGSTDIYWSANTTNTTPSITPSGTSVATPILVKNDISGATDLYLGNSTANVVDTYTASTISAYDKLTIKGRRVDNDFIVLQQDEVKLFLDGTESIVFRSGTHPSGSADYIFNSASQDIDFAINGPTNTNFKVQASRDAIRMKDHVTVGGASFVSWNNMENFGLAVTGTSYLVSGGTNGLDKNAITASGNTHIHGSLSANTNVTVDGTLSANTISSKNINESILTIQSDEVKIASHGGSPEYLNIKDDVIKFYIDNSEAVTFDKSNSQYLFNAAQQDYDFVIGGSTGINTFQVDVSSNLARFRDHLTIGTSLGISSQIGIRFGLSVTGTSYLISGGTQGADKNAITTSGNTHIHGVMSANTAAYAPFLTTDYVIANSSNGLWLKEDGGRGIEIQDGGNIAIGGTGQNANEQLTVSAGISGVTVYSKTDMYAGVTGRMSGGTVVAATSLSAMSETTIDGNLNLNGYVKYKQPAFLDNNAGSGEIAYFGIAQGGSTTKGKLYYLQTNGAWDEVQANASSNDGNSQLLGIALGSTPASNGMLLRGFFDMNSHFTGTFDEGIPVYIDDNNSGYITVTQPAGNNEFVRVVGYCTNTANVIYFNPDGTYITVNA